MTGVRLLRGDCIYWLPKIAPGTIDVVVTSPPYNLDKKYGKYNDNLDEAAYLDFIFQVAQKLHPTLRDDGSIFLNIGSFSKAPLLPFKLITLLGDIFKLQNTIIWSKSITVKDNSYGHFQPTNSERFLSNTHEFIFHLTKTGKVRLNRLAIGVAYQDKSNIARRGHAQDLRCRGNTWFIPYQTVQRHSQKFNHPALFPTELAQMCIKLHGITTPTVLDPFVGIGSTVIAAMQENARQVIGIDLDEQYIAHAAQRAREFDG